MHACHKELVVTFTKVISETNGISLSDTLDLLLEVPENLSKEAFQLIEEFRKKLNHFLINNTEIHALLKHPVSDALFEFFKNFPLRYNEEHIHLTGSISGEFIFPRLKLLFEGPNKHIYEKKIKEVYGEKSWPIKSIKDVDKLIQLKEGEGFSTYLKILYLPKLIFTTKEIHAEAACHMAEECYNKYNIGRIRLKFSLSRSTSTSSEQIPGIDDVDSEDVVLGLYDGFKKFQELHPEFDFVLSPSFRKEASFFDSEKFPDKTSHFLSQVDDIILLLKKYPYLQKYLTDVDTVGDERELYRKEHFKEMKMGFRKLQFRGIKIRSHHGETWHTLKKGIQAVDNALNIWHVDTLEHGISLGINPNKYFHQIYIQARKKNEKSEAITRADFFYNELLDIEWGKNKIILDKLFAGQKLTKEEYILFLKAKFHTAREVEHYQHDVLNRIIQKEMTLVALPSSNNKLTGKFEDYKEHPFSWWEKKNVALGIGTDNYITLRTNFIQEMLILLYTDVVNLKITKLLMVASGETRRPYISHHLWMMRKKIIE